MTKGIASDLEVEPQPYRVDGKVGRIEFPIYRLCQAGQLVYDSREVFPVLFGKEWDKTRGWKDLVVTHGCIQRLYRKTSGFLNRVYPQPETSPIGRFSISWKRKAAGCSRS